MFTRPQCSWLLLLTLPIHPVFHLLDAVITLGDRLPARTRMDLRELARQEIVQSFEQDHLQRPTGIIEALDQVVAYPRQKLLHEHLVHDPLLPPAHVQAVLLCVHNITILVDETVHRLLSEGYSPEASQMREVQAPLG